MKLFTLNLTLQRKSTKNTYLNILKIPNIRSVSPDSIHMYLRYGKIGRDTKQMDKQQAPGWLGPANVHITSSDHNKNRWGPISNQCNSYSWRKCFVGLHNSKHRGQICKLEPDFKIQNLNVIFTGFMVTTLPSNSPVACTEQHNKHS